MKRLFLYLSAMICFLWLSSCPEDLTPGQVSDPNPPDNATDVSLNVLLSWYSAAHADEYWVFLDTSASDVESAIGSSARVYKATRTETNYSPEGLVYNTTYYWRVDSRNMFAVDATKGTVWSFTTETPAAATYSWVDSSLVDVLEHIFGSHYGSVYAVGAYGIIYYFDGTTWDPITSPTGDNLMAIWAADSNNVFAVGGFSIPGNNGTIVQYDGTDWTAVVEADSPTHPWLRDVHGVSATNVFAVGDGGTILNYDGTDWNPMTSDAIFGLFGVWCHSATDVFAVGADGMILHFNGTDWSTMVSGTFQALRSVWAASATDVFAVGDAGTILHYDGTDWTAAAGIPTFDLLDVWGSSSSDVFAVGEAGMIYHFDGTSWEIMTSPVTTYLYSVCGSTTTTDVYAFGESGTIIHYGE